MKSAFWKSLTLASFALALTASAEDKPARVVKLPMTGLMGGCCDTAVEDTMKPLAAVASVKWEEKDKVKWAIVTLKKDATLELSKVQEALAAATKGMGKDMGTEYKLDEAALRVDASVVFRTAAIAADDKAKLEKAFAEAGGFQSCAVEAGKDGGSSLSVKFEEKSLPSLEKVAKILKDAKIELKDVVFLGAP